MARFYGCSERSMNSGSTSLVGIQGDLFFGRRTSFFVVRGFIVNLFLGLVLVATHIHIIAVRVLIFNVFDNEPTIRCSLEPSIFVSRLSILLSFC